MVDLHPEWLVKLSQEFEKPYMIALKAFLEKEKKDGKQILPAGKDIFKALNTTLPNNVKVVILGQDPYPTPGNANGLAFSVNDGVAIPASLRNIYKELNMSLGMAIPTHGNLTNWATKGVLLLNSVLTVTSGEPNSHKDKGWEQFTNAVIETVNYTNNDVVFMLWGGYAQKKGQMIDTSRHLVLTGPHPSPLSAHRGFLGCGHFKLANDYLKSKNIQEVDWRL